MHSISPHYFLLFFFFFGYEVRTVVISSSGLISLALPSLPSYSPTLPPSHRRTMSFITPTLLVITTTLPTLLTLYLLHRNAQTFTRPYPALLANLQTKEEFTQAAIYAADKNRLARIKEIYESIKTIAGIFGIVAFMWKNTNNQSEILHSIYFLAAYMLFDTITSLPLTIYSTFGIEEKHGFNKQTVYTFVTDIIKEYIMTIIITAPIVTAIIYAVHWAGDRFYIYIFAFM